MNIGNNQVYKHPLEKERVQGFRPHGFDNMGPVFAFIEKQIELFDEKSFYKTYQNDQQYLFIKAEKPKVSDNSVSSRFIVELDAGYIDFEDNQNVSLVRINAIFHMEPHDITLLSAYEEGRATDDIEYVLEIISNGGYFDLVNLPIQS